MWCRCRTPAAGGGRGIEGRARRTCCMPGGWFGFEPPTGGLAASAAAAPHCPTAKCCGGHRGSHAPCRCRWGTGWSALCRPHHRCRLSGSMRSRTCRASAEGRGAGKCQEVCTESGPGCADAVPVAPCSAHRCRRRLERGKSTRWSTARRACRWPAGGKQAQALSAQRCT